MVTTLKEKMDEVNAKKQRPSNRQRSHKCKTMDLLGRSVLIPGDVYDVSGWWFKGKVVLKTKRGWKVAFPPQVGETKLIHEGPLKGNVIYKVKKQLLSKL